jgi:vacuolar protein sorting-associated protein 13A/C
MRMQWVQVDNQLPFVPMPVLFCPQKIENQSDYVVKFSMTVQTNNSLDFCVYPYVGVQVSYYVLEHGPGMYV